MNVNKKMNSMVNQQAGKKRWTALLIAGCLAMAMSAGSAWAAPEVPQAPAASSAAAAEDGLSGKQAEIDAYVFGDGQKDLAEQGFSVTHTGVVGDAVEVGITPYDEKHAEFLYEKFGRDTVHVVKGEQAVLYGAAGTGAAAAASTVAEPEAADLQAASPPAISKSAAPQANGSAGGTAGPADAPSAEANNASDSAGGGSGADALAQKQREIDEYAAGSGQKELAEQGFSVTHTGVVGNAVEVGIAPYDEKHAEFLYEKFGRDTVHVVKGEQAVLYGAGTGAAEAASTVAEPEAAGLQAASPPAVPDAAATQAKGSVWIAIAAAIVLAAGLAAAAFRKKRFSRS